MAYTTIDKPSDYFNTKLYTGDGGTQSVTGVGFQPDWTWIKNRGSSDSHNVYDSVRGVTKYLLPNNNVAEDTTSGVTAFNSDGFSVGNNSMTNSNSNNYASWNWKAGTSFTNDASATGIGSIDSSGSFNNDSGFSIVSYTGGGSNATVKHGLNTAPSMIIFKRRVGSGWNWTTYHKSMGNNYFMSLNLTNAKSNTSSSTYFQDTTPTSSVFSIGDSGHLNGNNIIAYCFAEKQGFSKFSSYIGNGITNGTFVYTGFKPAFVMVKKSAGTGNWFMKDTARDPGNPAELTLAANSASSAAGWGTGDDIDLLSNGFKMRDDTASINTSGDVYIYMAFAENPFVASNFNAATAR